MKKNQIKTVSINKFGNLNNISANLKTYNFLIADGPLGKTTFFNALIFLSSGLSWWTKKHTSFIPINENYATLEVDFINSENTKNNYKVLYQEPKTTFWHNNKTTTPNTFANEILLFAVQADQLFFNNLELNQKWIAHKISKKHPEYWSAKQILTTQLKQLNEINNKKKLTVLEEQQQKELAIRIWRTSLTWQKRVADFFQLINQHLPIVVESFPKQNPKFNLMFCPFNFDFSKPQHSTLYDSEIQNFINLSIKNPFSISTLFFGLGFKVVSNHKPQKNLSRREKLNQQLFLEIVVAMLFCKQNQTKPILLIDNFDYFWPATQKFIWRHANKFSQILLSVLVLNETMRINVPNFEKTKELKIISSKTN